MNGVEILSSETIYETTYSFWPMITFLIIGFCIGIILTINECIDFGFSIVVLPILLVSIGMGFMIGFFATIPTEHSTEEIDYIEYKVTIDDSVSMNEFTEKYEILDQEGKIYTVKERE